MDQGFFKGVFVCGEGGGVDSGGGGGWRVVHVAVNY